jgi:dihydroorotate dehydrogenase (NAD+) catalytic subunit
LANPVMLAAGVAGHGAELAGHCRLDRLGAMVVKSLHIDPWPGNPAPRVAGVASGMLNSVGLQGPGVRDWVARDLPTLIDAGVTVVASIWGRSLEEYRAAAEALTGVAGPVALEVNLSCPNLEGRGSMFAHDADLTATVVEACTTAGLPVWAKLSPNTDRIVEIAGRAAEAGADAVTVGNTLLGLAMDPRTGRPALGGIGGGLSGPAIAPVALRAVWDVRRAHRDLPIVGVGGISSGRAVVEMMSAGASAVQVGTAVFARPDAPTRILADATRFARSKGIASWADVVDSAHERDPR